jgi:lipopolysaccharide/colanic/teichoic acid biosynthesis glycosyltransferase
MYLIQKVTVLLLLLILSPILLLLAVLVKLNLGSPIVFRQDRPGKDGIIFTIIKFRTMLDSVNSKGDLLSDEDRLTKFGQFLRSTSLDELPELYNVVKGEMNLVGPRPLLIEYLPLYNNRQARRHEILPGITGWAQVNGRNEIPWEDRLEMDVWYVENHSLWLDMKILFLTVFKVFKRDGINQAGHATMPYFSGTKTKTNDD